MKEWLSIVEYARHHQLSDMTVRRRIKTGRLEAVLQEGKYYIPAARTREFTPSAPFANSQSQRTITPARPASILPPPTQTQATPTQDVSAAKTREWFTLCREILVKLTEKEKWLEKHIALKEQAYEAKIALLQEESRVREIKMRQLTQQVEDLQVFIQLLDEKKAPLRK
jgi:hypothetical protein